MTTEKTPLPQRRQRIDSHVTSEAKAKLIEFFSVNGTNPGAFLEALYLEIQRQHEPPKGLEYDAIKNVDFGALIRESRVIAANLNRRTRE